MDIKTKHRKMLRELHSDQIRPWSILSNGQTQSQFAHSYITGRVLKRAKTSTGDNTVCMKSK